MKLRYIIPLLAALLLFNSNTMAQDPDPEWTKRNTWFFDNFKRDTLPWEIFRETFLGVAPFPSGDFDLLFYNELYKEKVATPGFCYGMDVMALLMLKNGGHLGYCHPPYVYPGGDFPDDTTLEKAIQITHGNQMNHSFLSFILDVVAIGKMRDGNYCYDKIVEYLAKNDPPIICMSPNSITSEDGHVVVPYAVTQSGSTRKIWIYDNNHSWYKPGANGFDWYAAHKNFITVNAGSGAWSYQKNDTTVWSGDPGSGGRLFAAPLSVAGKKDRLPQSLIAEGAYALNTILIFGNVNIEQIMDPVSSRHLVNDAGTDLEENEDKRMNNLIKFIPLNGGRRSVPVKNNNNVFFFRGSNPMQLRFKAYGKYKIGMIYQGKYFEMSGSSNGESSLSFSPEKKYIKMGGECY